MAPINSKDLSVLKDMCGSHFNFTTLQLARISELAREMKMILEDSKKRCLKQLPEESSSDAFN
jgi:hypothetical protein